MIVSKSESYPDKEQSEATNPAWRAFQDFFGTTTPDLLGHIISLTDMAHERGHKGVMIGSDEGDLSLVVNRDGVSLAVGEETHHLSLDATRLVLMEVQGGLAEA